MELISRADAIKDAESWVAVDEHERHLQKNVIEWLKEFPPAEHGTNLAEVGTDCISRQAAIDTIEDFPHGDVWNVESMEEMVDRIKQLPPIQQKLLQPWEVLVAQAVLPQPAEPKRETATVSVGKSKGGVTMWYECATCGEPVDQGDTFCSGCGRRLIHE